MSDFPSPKQPRKRRLLFLSIGLCAVASVIWSMDVRTTIKCREVRKLLAAGDIPPALALAEQVVAANPDCSECHFLLAKAARRAGDFAKASAALQLARDENYPAREIAFEQVLAAAQSGQVKSVDKELRHIFASELQGDETEEIYHALALGHLAAFDVPEFLKCIDFWLAWRPEAVVPRQMKAELYSRLGEHRSAVDQFQAILTEQSDFLPARKGLGDSLLALNLPTEAEKELRVCYERDPGPQHALGLAKCLVRIDRSDEARSLLKSFENAADRVTRAEILEELGRWHLDRQEVDEAFQYLQECVRIAPENFSAWHALSTAYSMQMQSEKASDALNRSLAAQQRAQRLFVIANELSHDPMSITLRLEASDIMFQQGMNQDGVSWLRTILLIDEDNSEAVKRLSDYYNKTDAQKQEAP